MDQFIKNHVPDACPQCRLNVTSVEKPFCARCGFDLFYGKLRKKTTVGKCIYCEQEGKLSAEHIYGKWLINVFGRATRTRIHSVGRPSKQAFWEKVPFHRDSPDPAQGDVFDSTVSNVCELCNNTWMSDIHKAARPLVTHLANGGWQVHSTEEAAVISRWVAMVSINLECQGRILNTPQHQRTALKNGQMPDGWEVRFGNLAESRRSSYFQTLAVPIEVGSEGIPLYFNNTHFCVERVVFHSRSSIGNMSLGLALTAAGQSNTKLPTTQLWPSDGRSVDELFKAVGLDESHLYSLEIHG